MHSLTISPKVSLPEKLRFYRQYVRKMRLNGHKPVSLLRFMTGRL